MLETNYRRRAWRRTTRAWWRDGRASPSPGSRPSSPPPPALGRLVGPRSSAAPSATGLTPGLIPRTTRRKKARGTPLAPTGRRSSGRCPDRHSPDNLSRRNESSITISFNFKNADFSMDKLKARYSVCPGSSDPFYVSSYYVKWVTTSWTYCTIYSWAINYHSQVYCKNKWTSHLIDVIIICLFMIIDIYIYT